MSARLDDQRTKARELFESSLRTAKGGKKMSQQAIRISEVCEKFVSLRPPINPTAHAVSEQGRLIFQDFPALRSLYNRYAWVLEIWRNVYFDTVNYRSRSEPNDPMYFPIEGEKLMTLDEGTRANIIILQRLLKETKSRNDAYAQFIRENIPEDSPATNMEDASLASLREDLEDWLNRISSGSAGFDIDSIGIRTSRLNRPGTVVMPLQLFNGLRDLVKRT